MGRGALCADPEGYECGGWDRRRAVGGLPLEGHREGVSVLGDHFLTLSSLPGTGGAACPLCPIPRVGPESLRALVYSFVRDLLCASRAQGLGHCKRREERVFAVGAPGPCRPRSPSTRRAQRGSQGAQEGQVKGR